MDVQRNTYGDTLSAVPLETSMYCFKYSTTKITHQVSDVFNIVLTLNFCMQIVDLQIIRNKCNLKIIPYNQEMHIQTMRYFCSSVVAIMLFVIFECRGGGGSCIPDRNFCESDRGKKMSSYTGMGGVR